MGVIERGAHFGRDGAVRYVILIHKPGNGYGVTWDSVPFSTDLNYWDGLNEREKVGKAGYMPLHKFLKWKG